MLHHLAYLAVSGPAKKKACTQRPRLHCSNGTDRHSLLHREQGAGSQRRLHNGWMRAQPVTVCTPQWASREGEPAAVESTRPDGAAKKNPNHIKREDKTCTSGSQKRVDAMNPARTEGGKASMRSWRGARRTEIHQVPAEKSTAVMRGSTIITFYLHKLTFGAVSPAASATPSLWEAASRSCSANAREAQVLFLSISRPLVSPVSRVQVNSMMMRMGG